jgi:hypothetical protein
MKTNIFLVIVFFGPAVFAGNPFEEVVKVVSAPVQAVMVGVEKAGEEAGKVVSKASEEAGNGINAVVRPTAQAVGEPGTAAIQATASAASHSLEQGSKPVQKLGEESGKVATKAVTEAVNGAQMTLRFGEKIVMDQLSAAAKAYERNAEAFAIAGRIVACSYTYCLSELYRNERLREAEAEQKQKLAEFQNTVLAKERTDSLNGFRSEIVNMINSLVKRNQEIEKTLKHLEDSNQTSTELTSKLQAEANFRKSMKAAGAVIDPVGDITIHMVEDMEKMIRAAKPEELKTTVDASFAKLLLAIRLKSEELKISVSKLTKEAVRNLSDEGLDILIRFKKAVGSDTLKLIADLKVEKELNTKTINRLSFRLKEMPLL